MTYKNFYIEYTAYDIDNKIIKSGKIKAKRKLSSVEAQVKFEEHLKKTYTNFHKLVVHKCYEENSFENLFSDILKNNKNDSSSMDGFNDLFNNLFK